MDTHTLHLTGTVGAPVPRWAAIAGWASLLLPLPSILWRLVMLAGADVGLLGAETYRGSAEGIVYVLALEAVQVIVAFLCLGLIRPWGEVVPHWIPVVGSRTIPRLLPTVIGGIGLAVLWPVILNLVVRLSLTWAGIIDGWTPDIGMSAGERALLLASYIPFFVWPFAITVAVAGYWVRRSPRRTPLTGTTRTTGSAPRPSSARE